MRINHNITALKASNNLLKTNNALDKSLERLSSGYRINHAADDAAGMAISQKMRTQIAGLEQASRNSSDGISLIQTAEGALVEVTNMVQRMRELSVQAANGTYTDDDRKSIQNEINELNEEIIRISEATEFNKMTLLDGSVDRKSFSDNKSVELISLTDSVAAGDYAINVTQDARQAVMTLDIRALKAAIVPDGVKDDLAGKININGIDIELEKGDTLDVVFEKIRNACDQGNITVFGSDVNTAGAAFTHENEKYAQYQPTDLANSNYLVFVSLGYGSNETITIHSDNNALAGNVGLAANGATATGVDAKATFGAGFSQTATISVSGNVIKVTDLNGFEMKFESAPGAAQTRFTDGSGLHPDAAAIGASVPSTVNVTVLNAGFVKLQVGANENQTVEITIPKVTPKTLGIEDVNVCTQEGAEAAITKCEDAVNMVTAIRAKLGAYQNRLEYSVANLNVGTENMTEALSRIGDTDMASEMALYTQKNVLSQAGTSMLAQANQRPQTILSLLQG